MVSLCATYGSEEVPELWWRMHAASFPENTIGYASHLPCNETIIEHTSYKKSPVIPMCPCRRSSTLLIDLMSTVVDLSSIPFR